MYLRSASILKSISSAVKKATPLTRSPTSNKNLFLTVKKKVSRLEKLITLT